MSKNSFKIDKSLVLKPGTAPATPEAGELYFNQAESKFKQYDGIAWKNLGSGNGGSVNFIDNFDGSQNTTGWTEGSYAAAARPTGSFTASSGAGAFALSTTSTTPLGTGTTSFLLTKSSGASRQGRAIETSFALPLSYRAKVLQLNIDYIINSGSFVAGSNSTDSSLIWYCAFSTDNGSTYTVAEPSSFKLLSNSTTISDKFNASIQTPSDATNMKLIAYVAETANSAWQVETIVAVSPTAVLSIAANGPVGSIIATGSLTPPTGYLYANGGAVSRTTYSELFKVIGTTYGVGDGSTTFNLPDLRGVFARGAGSQTIGAETYSATLGQKQNDATSKNGLALTDPGHSHQYDMSGSGSSNSLWHPNPNNGWGSNSFASALYNDSLYGRFSDHIISSGSNVSLNNGDAETRPANVAVAYHICFNAGSVQVSDGYDGRIVSFAGSSGSGQAVTAAVTNIAVTTAKDSVGAWTGSTYVVKTAGDYLVTGAVGVQAASSAAGSVYLNGTIVPQGFWTSTPAIANSSSSGATLIYDCKVGDIISVRSTVTSTISQANINIFKLAGNPVISATETVGALYTGAPPTGTLGAAYNITTFGTKVKDSHGAYASGTYIVPVSGQYDISAQVQVTGSYASINLGTAISIFIDGVDSYSSALNSPSATTGLVLVPRVDIKAVPLRAGQVITIRVYTDATSVSYSAVANRNFFSITRSGGY